MAGPADLHALAVELLDACVEALNGIPAFQPDLDGAPDRAFVSPGKPAVEDCDQLVVHVDSIQMIPLTFPTGGGLLSGRRNVTGTVNQPRFVITISRCIDDTLLTAQDMILARIAAELQATAEQTNADAWAIWNHIYWLWNDGLFLEPCRELFFEGAIPLPAEGGRAGWVITLRASLDGYDDVPSS